MSFFGVFVFVFFFPLFSFSFSFGCCSGVVVCGWLFVGVSLLGLWFVLAFSIVYLSSWNLSLLVFIWVGFSRGLGWVDIGVVNYAFSVSV